MSDIALVRPRVSAVPPQGWRQLNLAALTALTAYSAALGWQAQVVSYPLYRAVGDAEFAAYHRQYDEAIPIVVVAPGFASFLSGAAFYWTRPPDVPRPVAAVVSVAGVVSIASTVLWAIPMHDRLDQVGRSAATIDSLLRANLLRTAALTASTLALVWSVWRGSGASGPARARRRWARSSSPGPGTGRERGRASRWSHGTTARHRLHPAGDHECARRIVGADVAYRDAGARPAGNPAAAAGTPPRGSPSRASEGRHGTSALGPGPGQPPAVRADETSS